MRKLEKILTVEQMVLCEQKSDKSGVSLAQLMDNAGEKLAEEIILCCKKISAQQAVILVGKGNNGGDGLVAARVICEKEKTLKPVIILCCGEPDTELSKNAFDQLPDNVKIFRNADENALKLIENAPVLCDCIFGTGFYGNLRENIKPVFEACKRNTSGIKIACDVPSGANARNGEADSLSFSADFTLTFHRKKLGLLLSPCRYFAAKDGDLSRIKPADIDIPKSCENSLDFDIRLIDENYAKEILPERIPYGHKGTFGKVVSVCGSENYRGAAFLSAMAAMRTGVGLFELCTPKAVIDTVSSSAAECIYSKMNTDSDGFMTSDNADKILEKCGKAQAMLLGCGLGNTKETQSLVKELIENSPCPIILDADGINSLCPNIDVLYKKKSQVILTPHPAELARLLSTDIKTVISDRLGAAKKIAEEYGVTVLAKSAETIAADCDKAIIVAQGNTALSKGGSGDMLAGITASFAAQGLSLLNAGALASHVMGKTAELCALENSERGILAHDIIVYLPKFLKQLEG